jgi:hypothetical protein
VFEAGEFQFEPAGTVRNVPVKAADTLLALPHLLHAAAVLGLAFGKGEVDYLAAMRAFGVVDHFRLSGTILRLWKGGSGDGHKSSTGWIHKHTLVFRKGRRRFFPMP